MIQIYQNYYFLNYFIIIIIRIGDIKIVITAFAILIKLIYLKVEVAVLLSTFIFQFFMFFYIINFTFYHSFISVFKTSTTGVSIF